MKRKPSTAKLMGRHISRSTWHNTTAEKSILPGTRSTAGSVVDSLPCGVVWGGCSPGVGIGFSGIQNVCRLISAVGLAGIWHGTRVEPISPMEALNANSLSNRDPRPTTLTTFSHKVRLCYAQLALRVGSMAPHSQSYGAVASPQNHTGIATAVSHAGFDRGERETTASLSLSLALNKLVNDVSWSPPAHDPVGRVDMCMWRIGSYDCAHFHADLSPFFSDHCGPIRSNPI